MNILIIIRSIIYNLFIVFWNCFVGTIFLPALFLPQNNLLLRLSAKIWGTGLYLGLRVICNLKIEVRGIENLPSKPYIIASKHQSALDVIVFNMLLDFPKFIMRKSLIYIPFMGIYCYRMGMIFIDRSGGASTLKSMLKRAKKVIDSNDIIIIYPEGTRIDPGKKGKYNPGIAAIYKACNAEVVPVALNTGVFWKKNGFLKLPGTFIVEFLPSIKAGLDKDNFLETLENQIESACAKQD